MKKKILLIPLALLLAMSLLAAGCPAPPPPAPAPTPAPAPAPPPAPEIVTFQYWTAPFGSGPYVQSHAVHSIAKKTHPWLRLEPIETTGFVWNLKAVTRQPIDTQHRILFGSNPPMLYMAESAMAPFEEPVTGFKALYNAQICGHFMVTLDPDIKTPADLEGKKVSLGWKTQICYGVSPMVMLEAGYGLVDGENIDLQFIGMGPAVDALLDGLVDACISEAMPILGTTPMEIALSGPLVKLLGSGKHLYYLSFEHSAIEKARQATGWPFDPYLFPAGSLDYQEADIEGYGWPTGVYVVPDFPEDMAYEIAKFWYEECAGKLVEYGDQGKPCTKKMFSWGLEREAFHPGALKFFDEVGIKVPDYEW